MNFDLATTYGSLQLNSPVIVGSCPLTADELIRISLVNAGVGAIVLPSLFEEQVVLWNDSQQQQTKDPAAHDDVVLQRAKQMNVNSACYDAPSYLKLVQRASSQMSIPVIASLNGQCAGHWLDFAEEIQNAGADAIELFVRHPAPSENPDPRKIEDAIVDTARRFHEQTSIPLFLKLGAHYTSLTHLAQRLNPFVDGIVLFGTSPAVDIELDRIQLASSWELTESGSIGNSLESIMGVHSCCPEFPLAANGGIGSSLDLIKAILAGADVAMVTSAIYRDGPTAVGTLMEGLMQYMKTQKLASLNELKEKRPCIFDCIQDRETYIKAVASTIESGKARQGIHVTECDRWGHPRSPR